MRITNKTGLPAPLYHAACKDRHKVAGDVSVTQLIAPIRLQFLLERHDDEIEVDVTDLLYRLYGSVLHKILEEASDKTAFIEATLWENIAGLRLYGTSDRYTGDGAVYDWKFPGIYTVKNPKTGMWDYIKPEWEAQLNLYRWLWVQTGFHPKGLYLVPLFRDWKKRQAKIGKHPPFGAMVLPVRMWDLDVTEAYIRTRIALRKFYADMPDDLLPVCTPKERWARPEKWAAMRKGRKRSLKNYDAEEDAEWRVSRENSFSPKGQKPYYVERRPGENIRCEDYCEGAPWCS